MSRRRRVMRPARYRDGVYWIAHNDDTGNDDPEEVAGQISTLLLADLFGAEPEDVAADIIDLRRREGMTTC